MSATMSFMNDIAAERMIGSYSCGMPGPLILAVGGIHGNEPNGPKAIRAFLQMLETQRPLISGTFLGLLGNIRACAENQRFIDKDLNRCFLPGHITMAGTSELIGAEEQELKEMAGIIDGLKKQFEDVCFIDCHTTSAQTIPYLSTNPHPESLQLANRFPLHNVIGLQQSIPGCLAEYCNKLNFRGFTFEAGQHLDSASLTNQVAMLWLLLVYSGALHKNDCNVYQHYEELLTRYTQGRKRKFRLLSHYRIKKGEEFVMKPGFENFNVVAKGALLAGNRYGDILAPTDGYILMPLYQKKGEDGFFLLEEECVSP